MLHKKYILTVVLVMIPVLASAQKVSAGINAIQLANLGTINAEVGIATSQHWSVVAGGRFNDWKFDTDNDHLVIQNRQKTIYAGMRYWPWYVFSGWWIEGKAQYSKFDRSGIWRHAYHTGSEIGAAVSGGYTLMLSERFNVEFGFGVKAGIMPDQTLYQCPVCLDVRENGSKGFIGIDDIKVTFTYVFKGRKSAK